MKEDHGHNQDFGCAYFHGQSESNPESTPDSKSTPDSTKADVPAQLSRRGFVQGLAALGVVSVVSGSALAACAPKDKGSSGPVAQNFDLVIVGAGGSGMAAALSAKESGVSSLVILEKEGFNGGNTNFSSSGMNASETRFQKEQAVEDSNQLFAEDTYKGGKELGKLDLIKHMCDNSAEAIDWLDSINITLDNITLTGGSSVKRCHRPTDGSAVGKTLVPGLVTALGVDSITIANDVNVKKILVADGKVTGVEAANGTVYNAKAVIITTGGFGANFDMIAQYRPDLKDYVTTNAQGTQGDGMRMAADVGAKLIDMDQIQIHPTVDQASGALIAEGIRGGGAILVNSDAKRFIDEMLTRDVVSAAELAQPGAFAYVLYDQQVYDKNPDAANYEKLKLSTKADTLADLAKALGLDGATLETTVNDYNKHIADGVADEFKRTQGMILLDHAPFYACKVAPGIHHCMGGIDIDTRNQALDTSGKPIAGLFAAGETTGGIHGANRLGGNAVCDIMV
ncbi:MAG: flavocytochrome c, partial [Coriobacteriales bacterium]|nr:flavocytochrome c [Coriobacteriales bacterium]